MQTRIKIIWLKLTHWEYWPWQVVYVPIFIYWLWCGLKARAIFWFSAANPGFAYGGMVGTSKHAILSMLPEQYLPTSVLIKASTPLERVEQLLQEFNLHYPLIIKPDIGERGFHVALLKDRNSLESYINTIHEDHLIQEYLELPLELGVFYHRFPENAAGEVTSVVRKRLLQVKGDGQSTVLDLMMADHRSVQQVNRLQAAGEIDLARVLSKEEELLLEPIGNHVRGTTFLDARALINDKLQKVFDDLAGEMDGFYYGRFDLRCATITDLYEGNFKVMEVNGAASEPAHIYAPNYPLMKGYRELFKHWRILYKISLMNHQKGVPYMSFRQGLAALKKSRFTRSA